MRYGLEYALILVVGVAVSAIATPLLGSLGKRWGIVAEPGGRRQHTGSISRLGGLGLSVGFFAALALSRLLSIPTADPNEGRRLWGLVIGGLVMAVFGLIDDRYELPAGTEYLGYLLAAIIATASLIILERFNNPLTNKLVVLPALLYIPLTLFWMTGMIVTVNWLDGLDGLAAGVAAILATVLSVHMYRSGQYSVVPLALALLGASLGFLIFNAPPARVFLGGSAFFLGYVLGALGLIAGGRVATVLLVMGIPIVDVAWTILDRWRHGVSPVRADRRHLHFRLQDAGISTRAIVFIYWGFCAIAGALALLLASRIYKLLTLIILGGFTAALLLYLSREQAPRRKR
ncbi:MAG: undecaprenyl/decaprenyl-phosphate alpha-N-acetylglucosaminyl 1-phosphate transferase [Anaerolineae bacterium]|nr:undecaprenyl/decaprenyl-phosphate alpha-N-acetylglucosaminyl 1-phosphate transferase [Anaerolineae bacterium]